MKARVIKTGAVVNLVTVNPWIDTEKDHTNIQDAVMEILPQWYDVEVDFPDEEPSDWAKYYNRL